MILATPELLRKKKQFNPKMSLMIQKKQKTKKQMS